MGESLRLSELQYAVMAVIWERKEATAAEVQAALGPARDRALTTIATLLSRLEKRGLLEHDVVGRQFVYRAVVSRDEVRRSMIGGLADTLFEGDVPSFICQLLSEQDVSPDDLARVREWIEARERGLGS